MKKIFLFACLLTLVFNASSQDVNRTFGVGLQSSLPTYGISVKYALTASSVAQATIAPFGSGLYKINFFGGRYIHRFPGNDGSAVSLDPYLYAGAGLITYSDFIGSKYNFFSYSVGGGLEVIVAKKLGLSAELGYGKLNVLQGLAAAGITGGGGIHFYIF